MKHYKGKIRMLYEQSFFLGFPKVPCHPRCSNVLFFARCLLSSNEAYINVEDRLDGESCLKMCSGCDYMQYAQTKLNMSTMGFNAEWLALAAKPDVKFVILGSAAWWSVHQGLNDPTMGYSSMLSWVEPTVNGLVAAGKRVIWMGAPPMLPPFASSRYGWQLFAGYDQMARDMIGRVGVGDGGGSAVFFNTSEVTWQRKRDDSGSSYDGLHWCLLAETSTMQTVAKLILDHMATSCAQHADC